MIMEITSVYPEMVRAHELLEAAKSFSTCKDKQVAAVAFYEGQIVGLSWNEPNLLCKGDCAAKHKKCATHAEVALNVVPGARVYVSLFPCPDCQLALFSRGVTDVRVFGAQHKLDTGLLDITLLPDLVSALTKFNGYEKQVTVAIGEMAELTSALCNSLRKDARDNNIPEEIIDVELQLHCIRRLVPAFMIQNMKVAKYSQLVNKFCGSEE